MKKKKLIFILALFAVIWNSCFDDLPYSRRQERNQKTTDDAISLNAVKKVLFAHPPIDFATDTRQGKRWSWNE